MDGFIERDINFNVICAKIDLKLLLFASGENISCLLAQVLQKLKDNLKRELILNVKPEDKCDLCNNVIVRILLTVIVHRQSPSGMTMFWLRSQN